MRGDNMFYVYEWFIVDTNEIIYVGKGCKNRYKVRKHNLLFNEMIKRFKCDSRIVKWYETEKDAFEGEFERVKELKKLNQCVCNIYNGGYGGTQSRWTEAERERYSQYNVMKSESQRQRMREHNPMSNPVIAEKTNGQKRRYVIVGNTTYKSIKEAKDILNVSYDTILRWAKHGISDNGERCIIENQKMWRHRTNKTHDNQQPSQGNVDNSTLEGSTTNG